MPRMPAWVYWLIVLIVTLAWSASLTVSIVAYVVGGDYKVDPEVHALFGLVVGVLFGFGRKSDRNNGSGDKE